MNRFRDFEDGTTVTALGFDIVLRRRTLGQLALPTGRLVACDPFTSLETEPFDVTLSPGSYPVSLIVAELRDEQRAAYAVVRLADAEAVRWELAELANHEETTGLARLLEEDAGYHVESCVGCFMDMQTANTLIDYTQIVMPDDNEFDRQLRARIRKSRKKGVAWASVDLARDLKLPGASGNVVAFDTGYGVGHYPTYLGRDSEGAIVSVVTDFQVLDFRFQSFAWK